MRHELLLAVLVFGSATAADVYRWVDRDGVVHYSDQWQPGAEKVRIQETATYSGSRAAGSKPASTASAPPAATGYRSLTITSPAQEEVLWNIEGRLRVALQASPALRGTDRVRLYLDGSAQELAPGTSSAELTDVFRGVHTLKADVLDAAGKVLISSETTSFVVRQQTVSNQARPTPRP
jgi:hypothetical protein